MSQALQSARLLPEINHLYKPRRVVFLILPSVHALDLAGPIQVFWEANGFGGRYELSYCGLQGSVEMAQGLTLSGLQDLPDVGEGDLVIVPGVESSAIDHAENIPVSWLRDAYEKGSVLCSICSGAFILGAAGLLDGRRCTTHWKVAERLAHDHPTARVLTNRLFVRDGRVVTSAGVAAGIDLALDLVEEDLGPLVTARVAREIVVYLRRSGERDQRSIFLEFRTHLHPGIHRVQDWLISHPEENPSLDELARVAGMSTRNLTRVFRQSTGVTLKAFSHRLKLELATSLLEDPRLGVEGVASRCGFADARQFRRLWRRQFGVSPSEWKAGELAKRVR